MPRHDAFFQLVAACDGFAMPVDDLRSDFELVGDLAHHVVATAGAVDGASRIGPVLDEVEELLGIDDPQVAHVVTYGFLEDLQNIVSHVDTTATPSLFQAMLGERTRLSWQSVEALWGSVAEAVAMSERPPTMDLQKYLSISNLGLRHVVQRTYRTMANDQMIGLADVLRFETDHGGEPHRSKV